MSEKQPYVREMWRLMFALSAAFWGCASFATVERAQENLHSVALGAVYRINMCDAVTLPVVGGPDKKALIRIGNMVSKPATVIFRKAGASSGPDEVQWDDSFGVLAIGTPDANGLALSLKDGCLYIPQKSFVIACKAEGKGLEIFHLSGAPATFVSRFKVKQPFKMDVSANQVLRIPPYDSESRDGKDEEWLPASVRKLEATFLGSIKANLIVVGKQQPVTVHVLDARKLIQAIKDSNLCAQSTTLIGELMSEMDSKASSLSVSDKVNARVVAGIRTMSSGYSAAEANDRGTLDSSPQLGLDGNGTLQGSAPSSKASGSEVTPTGQVQSLHFSFYEAKPDSKSARAGSGVNVSRAWLEDVNGNLVKELEFCRTGSGFSFTDPAGTFQAQMSLSSDNHRATITIRGSSDPFSVEIPQAAKQ